MQYPRGMEYPKSLMHVSELGGKGAESQVQAVIGVLRSAWEVFVQNSFSIQKVKFVGVLQN